MPQYYFAPDELRERLSYDPETGRLTWKKARDSGRIGKEAKCLDVAGYIQVNVAGSVLKGHRIAWAIYYGEWPSDHIDHINGVRNDNRIANLRCVNGTMNTQNKRNGSCKSKTGVLGVYFYEQMRPEKRYRAKIQANGKQYHLGGFSTPEEAHEAYVQAKRRLHAGCAI